MRLVRVFIVGVLLGVASSAIHACGDGRPRCTPANCNGCCDASGTCVAGTSDGACGLKGVACESCEAGKLCQVGVCTAVSQPVEACGPGNCAGCCGQEGCLTGNTWLACGRAGLSCVVCSSGQECRNGTCVKRPSRDAGEGGSSCGPDNCAGCCAGNTCIADGTSALGCGAGGSACRKCGSNTVCREGSCVIPDCAGCKDDAGVCLPGTTAQACGALGDSCVQCPAGQSCVNGRCSAGCDSATCAGCCAGNTCVPVAAQSAGQCGMNGAACAACGAGQACSEGACRPIGCGPGTTQPCGDGCCVGIGASATCSPGTSNNSCGAGGYGCVSCRPGTLCLGQQCALLDGGTVDAGTDGGPGSDGGLLGAVGQPCQSNAECAALGAGAICRRRTVSDGGQYTAGYCTRVCTDGQCPSDALCVQLLPSDDEPQSLCLKRCAPPGTTSPDCRNAAGYACYPLSTGSQGACWIYPAPVAAFGRACENDTHCTPPGNGFCYAATRPDGGASGYVDGYCSAPCTDMADCQQGGLCVQFSDGASSCQVECTGPQTGQGSCRPGYVCTGYTVALPDGGTGPSPAGYCRPNCNNPGRACAVGRTCTAQGYCQ